MDFFEGPLVETPLTGVIEGTLSRFFYLGSFD